MGSSYTKIKYNIFYHKLDAKYFHIKQFFRKKQYFLKKLQKTILSPLHTIHRYSQTTMKLLFREKIWISRKMPKMCQHTTRHRQQFSRATCEFVWSNKKCLCLCVSSQDCFTERRQHRMQNEKLVCETSAKTLYTLFVFRNIFVSLSIFCSCLWIAYSML